MNPRHIERISAPKILSCSNLYVFEAQHGDELVECIDLRQFLRLSPVVKWGNKKASFGGLKWLKFMMIQLKQKNKIYVFK